MGGYDESWGSLFDVASSVYFFALSTQCALAWIFAILFLPFAVGRAEQRFFRSWTRAWFAKALALTAILVRFALPQIDGASPELVDATTFSRAAYTLYQLGKFLGAWWLLEGALSFAAIRLPRSVSRFAPAAFGLAALATVLASKTVEGLLLTQVPLMAVTSLSAAVVLARLPAERQSGGTRITAVALGLQLLLWLGYGIALSQGQHGPWPLVRTPWTVLAAHNSYFDLSVDVLIAGGMVVLLLQDVHRRQQRAEAERNRLHAELERSERLRSLGTLISGVAHELNNPLTSILGFSEALGTEGLSPEQARQIEIIREQALRCRRIVRGLSTFSGKGAESFETIDLAELIERVCSGFEFELGRRQVTTSLESSGDVRLVGDRFALEQMVTNLVSNALKASPRDGRIRLAARGEGEAVELLVEDEGPGFPEGDLRRIFDPFFTTRAPGEGMGLGLSVVHGIVSAHGGSVRAENRAPRGARLRVLVPRRAHFVPEETPLPHLEIPRPPGALARPIEILVIEDEQLLCEMMLRVGQLRGWSVRVARNGAEGLAVLLADEPELDVVVCDIRMAPPSGIEIHDRLAAERPELLERFLFITGDQDSEPVQAFLRRCARPVLGKPFSMAEMAKRVEALAARVQPTA